MKINSCNAIKSLRDQKIECMDYYSIKDTIVILCYKNDEYFYLYGKLNDQFNNLIKLSNGTVREFFKKNRIINSWLNNHKSYFNKKYNIHKEFEKVYLRYRQYKNNEAKIDTTILDNVEFKKITKAAAGAFFRKYKNLLTFSSYEYQDVYNIAIHYGLLYTASVDPSIKETREYIRFLNCFIYQKMHLLLKWLANTNHNAMAPNTVVASGSFLENVIYGQTGESDE